MGFYSIKLQGTEMNNQTNNTFGICFPQNTLNRANLYDVVNACLAKAHALTAIAMTVDFEAYETDVISNYLWVLNDVIYEAKNTFNKLNNFETI